MPRVAMDPPYSPLEPVTEVMHGVAIMDPYRWLEDQDSPRTRDWLQAQQEYARSYLDSIPGRGHIRERIRDLLDVETYDTVQKVAQRYFFRKRLPGQEQPCIYFREGAKGADQLLIDPTERGMGPYTAVKPLRVSPDGRFLLYEVKDGGERTGTFELFDIESRQPLPDVLPRGYLRGFAFAPDARSFYYVHEFPDAKRPDYRAAYQHVLGRSFDDDKEIFFAGESPNLRLQIVSGAEYIGFLLVHFADVTMTDFSIWACGTDKPPQPIIRQAEYKFGPLLLRDGRILAITDRDAPNFRIVELQLRADSEPEFVDIVPEEGSVIRSWTVAGKHVFVSYVRSLKTEVRIFDLAGRHVPQLPIEQDVTVHLISGADDQDELLFEQESFIEPARISRYSVKTEEINLWTERLVPFDSKEFEHTQVSCTAKDGTQIPMYLVGRRGIADQKSQATVMTSYGGYGVSMTPQFSVFVAYLMERGCLFALPNIRGGSEFGAGWHEAAKRRKRQVAFDDFISAAEWLIESGRTEPSRLAIFGGSNAGLLVAAAMTQRPDLFRAVVCMVPILDMLRYHMFDNAHVWREEYGVADNPEDFPVLLGYSPYHNVRAEALYPATMIVSGDRDQNCNSLHARKMTARLQAASQSGSPILLDYNPHRGHSAVLPLTERISALTDRMAFLTSQLQLPV